jgi:hypothetical protein
MLSAWQSKSLLQCGTELDLIEVSFYPVGSVVAIPAFGAAAGERPWQLLWVTASPYVLRKKRTNDAFQTADDRPRAFEAGLLCGGGLLPAALRKDRPTLSRSRSGTPTGREPGAWPPCTSAGTAHGRTGRL